MDPIEKILSELAPPAAPGDLDHAMAKLFGRAEARARRRRILRNSAAMITMLTIGLSAGYTLHSETAPPATPPVSAVAPTVTYVYPLQGGSSALDFSAPRAEWLHSPGRVVVEIGPEPAVFSSFTTGIR